MQSLSAEAASYVRQRLSPFPWLAIPIFILVLCMGSRADASFWLALLWLASAIPFFRVFDDLFCFANDRRAGKESAHLDRGPGSLIALLPLLAAGFLVTSAELLPRGVFFGALLLISLEVPLYLLLKRSRLLAFVSMLKYPLLFFGATSLTGAGSIMWPVLGCAFFLVREVAEETFHLRSVPIECTGALVLVTTKLMIPIA